MSKFFDECKRLSELEFHKYKFEKELRKLRRAQLDEIHKALDCFSLIEEAPVAYKKHLEKIDYKTVENELKNSLEQDRKGIPFSWLYFHNYESTDVAHHYPTFGFSDREGEVCNLFLSTNYTPPKDWAGILEHLVFFTNILFVHFKVPQTLINMNLDLSLCKLIKAVYELYGIATMKGERELTRTKKTTRAIRDRADLKKTYVLEIYHRSIKIESGMKLNTIANIIRKIFIEFKAENMEFEGLHTIPQTLKPPGTDQIKRYLEGDGRLKEDFKKEGRYWILQR